MKTIIEIGANLGQDTEKFLLNKEALVYAFEPTKELYCELLKKFKKDTNLILFPFAVDEENALKQFFISATSNWGCSSLHEFNEDIHNQWPGRPDFNFTHSYMVPTIRLDSFCSLYNIQEIDYLHIDAQGNDFRVLKSLGDYIQKVKMGRCEVGFSVNLYKETENHIDIVKPWLEKQGFEVEVELDGVGKECDLIFFKK